MVSVVDKVAWIRLEARRVLSTRSRGRTVFYLPGGKPEPGESDVETLVREIREELSVAVVPASATYLGIVHGPAHGQATGTVVRMACFAADYHGTLAAGGEIDEFAWLTYADRSRVTSVDRHIFWQLHHAGQLT